MYSSSTQVTKGMKKGDKILCIWRFILLFVQAEKLAQNNRYIPLWEDAGSKKRGKRNKTEKNPTTTKQTKQPKTSNKQNQPQYSSGVMNIVQMSEFCQRKWKKPQTVLNPPPRNGVAVEMTAAFATNGNILIYAPWISSVTSPVAFQLWICRVKKLTGEVLLAISWLWLPLAAFACPSLALTGISSLPGTQDLHQAIKCTRTLWVNTYQYPKGTWGPESLQELHKLACADVEIPQWATFGSCCSNLRNEMRFRRVTQCFVRDSTKGKKSSVIGEGWIPAVIQK